MKASIYLIQHKSISFPVTTVALFLAFCPLAHADMPASSNFQLQEFSFGSGGVTNATSTNFKLNGIAGQTSAGQLSSTNYTAGVGLTFMQTAHIPSAPTITNPDNNYNKLKIVLATSSNPSDFNYAIAISPDNFASTTQYVQADGTLGVTSTWQTYMQWGETSGTMIIGLTENTTYTVKVKAKQGTFSESAFGPVSQAATVGRTLALSLSTNTVNLGELLPSTVVTAGTQVTVTLATNNASGGTAYSYGQNNGLKSINTNSNIATTSNNLDGISEGYGIRGISTTQSSGGPMQILSPYNGSGNTIGSIDTNKRPLFDSSNQPITAGQGIFEIKAKISPITKAANDYIDIITIIAATNL